MSRSGSKHVNMFHVGTERSSQGEDAPCAASYFAASVTVSQAFPRCGIAHRKDADLPMAGISPRAHALCTRLKDVNKQHLCSKKPHTHSSSEQVPI